MNPAMAKTSLPVLASSVLVALACFLIGETSSFRIGEGRSSFHLSRTLCPVDRPPQQRPIGNPLGCNSRCSPLGATTKPWLSLSNIDSEQQQRRRSFLTNLLSKGAAVACVASLPKIVAAAEGTDLVYPGTIKVTPIAHTFLMTGGKSTSPKPIRENDATRYFTNARVVYVFEGSGSNSGDNQRLAQDVIDLTKTRKAEKGPGVTPGNVQTLASKSSGEVMLPGVVETAKKMPDGDVLVVGPIPSLGTQGDGRLLEKTASGLGTFVGGKKEQGVISVLLNGPRENLKLVESGFPISELLWYSLPPKQ
jgi:hypothetical protein